MVSVMEQTTHRKHISSELIPTYESAVQYLNDFLHGNRIRSTTLEVILEEEGNEEDISTHTTTMAQKKSLSRTQTFRHIPMT